MRFACASAVVALLVAGSISAFAHGSQQATVRCDDSQRAAATGEPYRAYAGCVLPRNEVALLDLRMTRATVVDGESQYHVPIQGKEKPEFALRRFDSVELLPGRHILTLVQWFPDRSRTYDEHIR